MNLNLSDWTPVNFSREYGKAPLVSYLNRAKGRSTGLVVINRQAVDLLGLKDGQRVQVMVRRKPGGNPLDLVLIPGPEGAKLTFGEHDAKLTGGPFFAATGGKYATIRWVPSLVKVLDREVILLTCKESERRAAQ